jgi:hypothetical protein
MKFCAVLAACVGLSLLCSTAVSQTSAVAYSRQELLELAKQMREEANGRLHGEDEGDQHAAVGFAGVLAHDGGRNGVVPANADT